MGRRVTPEERRAECDELRDAIQTASLLGGRTKALWDRLTSLDREYAFSLRVALQLHEEYVKAYGGDIAKLMDALDRGLVQNPYRTTR